MGLAVGNGENYGKTDSTEPYHCLVSEVITWGWAAGGVKLDKQPEAYPWKLRKAERVYQYPLVYGNVNRLFDTKGMNRISGKPLKTRGSDTLAVAGIPCLLFGRFENLRESAEGVVTFEPSPKGIWTPWSEKMNTPWFVLNPVVKKVNTRGQTLEKKRLI